MEDQAAPDSSDISFPVIGIGASAGGLEAVSELLSALPAKTGIAFVLVQHLDPSHDSMLAEILARKTAMPVSEAGDQMALAPDRLYVIPPNATLTVSGDILCVGERTDGKRVPGPIDALFRSLAAARGRAAAAVLLSGASSDGTRGAQEIREAGGLVLAQDPESAAFPTMPRSAIDEGAVDMVLRPAQLGRRLAEFAEHFARNGGAVPDASDAADDEVWKRIFRLLRGAGGVDFTHYKRNTIQRRIARRQALRHMVELDRYAELLSKDSVELNALAQDVLIGVTSFFRDPESFDALDQTVFPALLGNRASSDPLRIWVPGCASGEELYSIAICLMEHLGERAARTPIQLFGTDVSEGAIARAREGSYPEGIESEVSPERLRRYFTKEDHHYRVTKSLRDPCVFARHDVTHDPPFSRIDLISCRNLLIYLEAGLQRQVIAQFHYALNPQGFLLLGPSETIGASAALFEMADKKRRVFRRRDVSGRAHARPARAPAPRTPWLPEPLQRPAALEADQVQREADRMLLARYAPAAIVVDEDLNVHQFRGQTGAYLEHASGTASLQLQQLAPPALLVALQPALREARTARAAVRRDDVRLETRGQTRSVSFEVSPFRMGSDDTGACYLVVFEEPGARPGLWQRLLEAIARRAPAPGGAAAQREQLQRELATTREFLQSSAEEHEATKEELKSLHEEALSANEELQSTNEELETAKEELQSTNEELATANEELRTRNEQLQGANDALVEARNFSEAIVETVRHPLLVLDRRMRVQSANAAFYELFRVEPNDTRGKLLYDLGTRQWDIPDLRRLLEETLSKSEVVEDYRVTHAFETLGERIMLLNARRLADRKDDAELILLSIEDVTERERAIETRERLAAIVDNSDDGIIGMTVQGVVTSWNAGAETLFGYSAAEAIGQHISLAVPENLHAEQDERLARIARGESVDHFETVRRTRDGRMLPVSIAVAPVKGADGSITGVSTTARDITAMKTADEALHDADRKKDEFLAMLGHELRNPLAALRSVLDVMRQIDIHDETLRWARGVLDRQTDQMTRLVDDLLEVARITRGTLALDAAEIALGDAVLRAIEATHPVIEARKHRLDLEQPPQPVRVHGDLVRLTQLFTNLLSNAARYTPPGGEIRVSIVQDGAEAMVTVSENGDGITVDRLARIFEPFAQSGSASRTGLGIGLPLARRIAELHGGSIEAESDGAGKGSVFTVRLPAVVREDESVAAAEVAASGSGSASGSASAPASASASAQAPASAHCCRVLVVDDNADAVDALQMLLEASGCDVRAARDGRSAVLLAGEFDPDVVLLDLALPDIDGYEVLRRLRAAGAIQPAVVALTGYTQPDDLARMKQAGFDHSLRKPADGDALVALVSSLCKGNWPRSGRHREP